MQKKLSMSRPRTSSASPARAQPSTSAPRAENLRPALMELLSRTSDQQVPVVRLKSQDETYNPDKLEIVLIRRHPYAQGGDYDPAVTEANGEALTQWLNAGIADEFPEDLRPAAEAGLSTLRIEMARAKHDAGRLSAKIGRLLDRRDQAEDESAESGDTLKLDRAQYLLDAGYRDLNTARVRESADALVLLDELARSGILKTQQGRLALARARLMSLWGITRLEDRVPGAIPEGVGRLLRSAEIGDADAELIEAARELVRPEIIKDQTLCDAMNRAALAYLEEVASGPSGSAS